MKIGFDAKRAFLNGSGLGNYSRNTLNALYKYYNENSYVLFTPEIKKELFSGYNRFDIISPDSSFAKMFKSLWRSFSVSGQLQKHELDLFHGLSNELPEGIHKTEVPSVVTIHDLIFMRFPQYYKPLDRKIYFRKTKYACTAATKIIAISKQTKEDIVNYLDIDPGKIEVLYQSISSKYFETEDSSKLPKKYELPENYIISVGTLEERKNQLSVLKAVKEAGLKTMVVFVGNHTTYSAKLLKYITGNGMEEQVKFLTGIPRSDLAGLYRKAQMSVYLSVFEGFGLPVIEAMASGCPVITSNTSCLPETAGGAALLCDPANITELAEKIKLLTDDKQARSGLTEKGYERAKLFHPERYAGNLISLYSETIKI